MYYTIKGKIIEALSSVLPIGIIVLLLCATVCPIPVSTLITFLTGLLFVVVGMGFFTIGAEHAMTPIGERMGAYILKSRKMSLIIIVSFLLGVLITVSEPDLQVLASQVPTVPAGVMVWSVGLGVGLFLVVALLRMFLHVSLRTLLFFCYLLVFTLAAFVPQSFWAISFDAGGVTTGPMTVPLIMAIGTGISSIRSDSKAAEDSFGLVALCSVGPILTVLVLGLLFPTGGAYEAVTLPELHDSRQLILLFFHAFPTYLAEVGKALGSIAVFFFVFNGLFLHLRKQQLISIVTGLLATYIGLVLFLLGANVGFMPAGSAIGAAVASLPYRWILIPIGMVCGFFIVAAEPAVHVLNQQVIGVTAGAIPTWALGTSLSVGVAVSIGLAMVRVLTGISILWILIPGYALAILLSFRVKPIFTAIAFDAGGVASGPMTATFLLPFAMGACEAVGGNVITDAFGLVALVAMVPLIAIQILGLIYQRRLAHKHAQKGN